MKIANPAGNPPSRLVITWFGWGIRDIESFTEDDCQLWAREFDYPNFKGRIHDKPDQQDKLPAYSRLWSQMLAYQTAQELK